MSNTVQACVVVACSAGLQYLGLPEWITAFLICIFGVAAVRMLQKGW
jgi:hypothetical protein